MDAATFRDRLERENEERLQTLDSPALLIAFSDGEPEATALLEAAANSEHAARRTFAKWAEDEEDEAVRAAFERSVQQEHRHYRLVAGELEGEYDPTDGGPLHAYLRGREETVQRIAAGMVSRSLVSVRAHAQVIRYFEDIEDDERARLFRELKTETEETLETGLSLLDARCDPSDWDRAKLAATYVIQVAHDDVADSLRTRDVESS